MNKDKEIYGIDISKDVFDVYSEAQVIINLKMMRKVLKAFKNLPKAALVVMEATGYYHYRLAQFLHKNGYQFL